MAIKHTPGPWHSPGLGEVHSEDHSIICDMCFHEDDSTITPEQHEANAILIAKTPEMYRLLLDMMHMGYLQVSTECMSRNY